MIRESILKHSLLAVFLGVILSFTFHPVCAKEGQSNLKKEISTLIEKNDQLNKEAGDLLTRVKAMRKAELEKMRADILKKLQKWDSGEEKMDGQELQTALKNAYFVAEGYGMDVPRLKKLYELSKRVILRAEFPQFCGSGIGTTKEFTEPVKDTAVVGNVVHFFNLVDKKEERMACVQKQKVELYKEINREFLRALTTPDPAAAAEAFRKYANAVRTQVTGQEVEAIQADLKALADEQANVAMFFSVIPLVGDAMDAMAILEGEDIAGQKLSALEKSFNAIMLLMPNALEMVVKRLATGSIEVVGGVYRYLKTVTETRGTILNAAARKAGATADALKQKAAHMLDLFGNTKAGSALADAAKKVPKWKIDPEKAVAALKREMPTLFGNRGDAITGSNMVKSHAEAFSKVAQDNNQIVIVRSVNPHAKELLEEGSAVAKGLHIKGKSSDMPFLEGHIPTDQAHSKLGTQLESVEEKLHDAKLNRNKTEIKKLNKEKKKLKAEMNEYSDKVKASLQGGHAKAITVKVDGQDLLSVKNPTTGKKYVVISDGKGGYLNPKTGQPLTHDPISKKKLSTNWNHPDKVRVLVDKRTGKPFTADYDLYGVGSSSHMGEVVSEGKSLGNIKRGELDTSTSLNTAVQKEGYQGRVVQHGPATHFKDKPDYPLTAFLPNGDVVKITNEKQLKSFTHTMKKQGYNGLEPHEEWGW